MPSLLALSEVSHYGAFEVACRSFTSKYFSMSSLKRVSLKSQCVLLMVAEYISWNRLTSTWNINKPFGFLLHRFNFPGKFQYLSPLPRGHCWLCTSNSQVYFLFKTLLLSPEPQWENIWLNLNSYVHVFHCVWSITISIHSLIYFSDFLKYILQGLLALLTFELLIPGYSRWGILSPSKTIWGQILFIELKAVQWFEKMAYISSYIWMFSDRFERIKKIRRCVLGVDVGFLEEVYYWGWALWLQKPMTGPVSFSFWLLWIKIYISTSLSSTIPAYLLAMVKMNSSLKR